MSKRWQFVLYPHAFDFVAPLLPAERLKVRMALEHLTLDPWQLPTSEIRPQNDRPLSDRLLARCVDSRSLRGSHWAQSFATCSATVP
jgi:hypothetical protein